MSLQGLVARSYMASDGRLLPNVAGIRALRLAANPETLPVIPTSLASRSNPRTSGSGEFVGTADYPEGTLTVSRKAAVAFYTGGKRAAWRNTDYSSPTTLATLGDPGPLVFIASSDGLHALDCKTGREVWSANVIDSPHGLALGRIDRPRPSLWAVGDHLLVLGTDHVTWLDAKTGAVTDVAEVPFSPPCGLTLLTDGVLVLDGTTTMDGWANENFLPSGLLVRRDASQPGRFRDDLLEDRVIPRCYGSIFRSARGTHADFSPLDVVLSDEHRQQRFLLPSDILEIGPVIESADSAHVLLYQKVKSGIFNDGRWLSMELSFQQV